MGATLKFHPGFCEEQVGALKSGEPVTIEYEPSRLAQAKRRFRGAELWNIEAVIRFHPGGGEVRGPVLAEVRDGHGGPVSGHRAVAFTAQIPSGTRALEVWFEAWAGEVDHARAYDSRHGGNYRFAVG